MNFGRVTRCAGALALTFCSAASAGELYQDSARSNALGRDVKFTVYVPDGYKDSATR